MSSIVDEEHDWPAVRVRQTFFDYFEQNGHSIGKYIAASGESQPLVSIEFV